MTYYKYLREIDRLIRWFTLLIPNSEIPECMHMNEEK